MFGWRIFFKRKKISLFLFDKLIYIDQSFVQRKFESITGSSPDTTVGSSSGARAGVSFGGVSASGNLSSNTSEKKSIAAMLDKVWQNLVSYGNYFKDQQEIGLPSRTGWVSAYLGFSRIKYPGDEFSNNHFILTCENGETFVLNHNSQYFLYQIGEMLENQDKLIGVTSLKVRALIKVLPVRSIFGRPLAAPLLMYED